RQVRLVRRRRGDSLPSRLRRSAHTSGAASGLRRCAERRDRSRRCRLLREPRAPPAQEPDLRTAPRFASHARGSSRRSAQAVRGERPGTGRRQPHGERHPAGTVAPGRAVMRRDRHDKPSECRTAAFRRFSFPARRTPLCRPRRHYSTRMHLKFTTAGESHGQALVSVLEGMPAGLPLLAADVNVELARRQQGYGRGRRMQIEQDTVEFLSGVRAGETLGSPIAMLIANRDWKNWREIMSPEPDEAAADSATADDDPPRRASGAARTPRKRAVTRVRPGHADLTGILKYDRSDARDILERASARETTARVAAAAVCKRLLIEF